MTDSVNAPTEIRIEEWRTDASRSAFVDAEVDMLAEVLHAGVRRVLVALLDERSDGAERIVGTVQLELDMPPNQQHRAAVAKLLVHPAARRRGIARSMMMALEEIAR